MAFRLGVACARAYCSECGSRLGAAPPVRCQTCGREHWRNAKPGAAGLVVRDDKLLLVRRAHEPWLDAWCAPSGFCDGEEHPILTAEREIAEEAGICARVVGFLGFWVGKYGDETADQWVSVAYYHAERLDDREAAPDGVETTEGRVVRGQRAPARGPARAARSLSLGPRRVADRADERHCADGAAGSAEADLRGSAWPRPGRRPPVVRRLLADECERGRRVGRSYGRVGPMRWPIEGRQSAVARARISALWARFAAW